MAFYHLLILNSRYKLTYLSMEMFLYYAIFYAILYQGTNWPIYQWRCFSIMLFSMRSFIKVQTDLSINGDVSPLCYFLCDPIESNSESKTKSGGTSSNTKSSAENEAIKRIPCYSCKTIISSIWTYYFGFRGIVHYRVIYLNHNQST